MLPDVELQSRRRMTEMVNGDVTVSAKVKQGRERDDAHADEPIDPDHLLHRTSSERLGPPEPRCPAMSQQRSDITNEAALQGFIRLIGCCNSVSPRSGPPDRSAPSPTLAPRM
jgi:hypothetical protein